MANKARIPFLILFVLCATVAAQDQTGKIVFYRESHFRSGDYKPPIFCDGVELGMIVNGGYLEVMAPAGHHVCVTELAQSPPTTIDIVPGEVVYLRVDITPTIKRQAFLVTTSEAEYRKQKKLKLMATTQLSSTRPAEPSTQMPPAAQTNAQDLPGLPASGARAEGAVLPGVGFVGYPQCLQCPDPKYTSEARDAHLEGTVRLKAVIGIDGKATDIEVVKGIGRGLDEQAVNAVRSWRFAPALGPNGNPVATIVPIEITFRLMK
jgi:TonB family protein